MGKINWLRWKVRCPYCDSIDIEKLNKFRRRYVQYRTKWKLKEEQKCICNSCKKEFWKI